MVEGFFSGFTTGEPIDVCEAMSRELLRRLGSALDEPSCDYVVEQMREVMTDAAGGAIETLESMRVTAVRVDGDVATAVTVGDFGGLAFPIPVDLMREDGRWVLQLVDPVDSRRRVRAFIEGAQRRADAEFECPVDASTVSDLFGIRLQQLSSDRGECRFGRPRRGYIADAAFPYVTFTAFPMRRLRMMREIAHTRDEPVVDRPAWGEDAYMTPDVVRTSKGRDVTLTGLVPTDGFAVMLRVDVPERPGAERTRDRVADALAALIRRG